MSAGRVLVDRMLALMAWRCPIAVASVLGGYFRSCFAVNSGNVVK